MPHLCGTEQNVPVMVCRARMGGTLTFFILDLIPLLRQSLLMFNFPGMLQGLVSIQTSCMFYLGPAKLVTVGVMPPLEWGTDEWPRGRPLEPASRNLGL